MYHLKLLGQVVSNLSNESFSDPPRLTNCVDALALVLYKSQIVERFSCSFALFFMTLSIILHDLHFTGLKFVTTHKVAVY